ncbi:hypothetical protein B0H21DRAFT_804739, partial [Amylocystis lapponica]
MLCLDLYSDSDSDSDFDEDSRTHTGAAQDTRETNPYDPSPFHAHTRQLRYDLNASGDIVLRVQKILRYMKELHLNLPLFLEALSWNVPELSSDANVRYARTALMVSEELPGILRNWYRPPRTHGRGIRTNGAREAFKNIAVDILSDVIQDEMDMLKPIMRSPQTELSESTLLDIHWPEMISDVQCAAPTLWGLLRMTAYTSRQAKKNKAKNPDASVLMMISIACFSRSHHLCKLPKLFAIYFKSCGLAAKAFDTLSALGICMSHKWMYRGINTISRAAKDALLADIHTLPWFGVHDNLNIAFRVQEQRLSNQGHFDSGTAGTIIVIKDPSAAFPDNRALQAQIATGGANPITYHDVLELEAAASVRIRQRAVHHILRILLDTPEFDLDSYKYLDSELLKPPPPVSQLPTGRQHATCQYMLNTVHIEEASYEGNDRVFQEWWRQLKLDSREEQKKTGLERTIIWAGDQLTVSRIRGLQKFRCEDRNSFERLAHLVKQFGWFHAQIALEHSLHSQFYLSRAGCGLVQAFELLNRKGLHS